MVVVAYGGDGGGGGGGGGGAASPGSKHSCQPPPMSWGLYGRPHVPLAAHPLPPPREPSEYTLPWALRSECLCPIQRLASAVVPNDFPSAEGLDT